MIYRCMDCGMSTFEITCPSCDPGGGEQEQVQKSGMVSDKLIPLDPSFYPEFQYKSKGLLKDLLSKKKEQAQLNELLDQVLRKYASLKNPYFVNFVHTSKDSGRSGENEEYSERYLFREVLIRKGFNELKDLPIIFDKLLMTTEFGSEYAGFAREISRHIKSNLDDSLISWIEEAGTIFRSDLSLFVYYLWEAGIRFSEINFNPDAASSVGIPLVKKLLVRSIRQRCEKLYFDLLVDRLSTQLEGFDPNRYVTMYYVDAMDGFEFESFLVELFQTIGYDVKETKKTGDQGADLFVTRFGRTTVIQAKNYMGKVGNSAVQQAISAKSFYKCDDAMVVTNSYFTQSAKELADSASVRLLDRKELQGFLDDYNQRLIEDFEEDYENALLD